MSASMEEEEDDDEEEICNDVSAQEVILHDGDSVTTEDMKGKRAERF
jgi:uncharacterized Zn ribbon protein